MKRRRDIVKMKKMRIHWTHHHNSSSVLLISTVCCFLLSNICNANHLPGCEFPQTWSGEWNLEGERDSLEITTEDFGVRGFCLKQEDDIYLIYSRDTDCYQCLSFVEQHPNVLQLQEGACQHLDPSAVDDGMATAVADYCAEFKESGVPLQTLVRLSGPNVDCELVGEFTFTYKTGQQPCKNPVSRIDRCMDSTQIAFKFESCPSDQTTNSKDTLISQLIMESQVDGVETLTCKGHWSADVEYTVDPGGGGNGGLNGDEDIMVSDEAAVPEVKTKKVNFLVGILEEPFLNLVNDKIRCFIYEETRKGGYRLAQSADASCRGLVNVRKDGYRTMHLKPAKPPEADDLSVAMSPCEFPTWATQIGTLHSFTLTSAYTFSEDMTTMTMSNYSHLSGESHAASISECQKIVEELAQVPYVRLVVKTTAQCETKFKCVNMFGRTEDIIEIQEGSLVDSLDQACDTEFMNDDNIPFTTLINAETPMKPCIAGGLYNVSELSLKGNTELCDEKLNGFQQVSISCEKNDLIQFLRECAFKIRDSDFFCLGGWEEFTSSLVVDYPIDTIRYNTYQPYDYNVGDGYSLGPEYLDFPTGNVTIGYLIARPKTRANNAPKRVCIVYTSLNETYFWTVDPTSCPRNIRPGIDGIFKFNATLIEKCGASSLLQFQTQLVFCLTSAFFWLSLTNHCLLRSRRH